MILSTRSKWIKYLSYAYQGKSHDLSILRTELPADQGKWFSKHIVHLDLGYLGVDKDYKFKELQMPQKKMRNKELNQGQKKANKKKSSIRVIVEHSIAGLKRYRFLSDRLRCRKISFYNKVAGICAGLWNFILTC